MLQLGTIALFNLVSINKAGIIRTKENQGNITGTDRGKCE